MYKILVTENTINTNTGKLYSGYSNFDGIDVSFDTYSKALEHMIEYSEFYSEFNFTQIVKVNN